MLNKYFKIYWIQGLESFVVTGFLYTLSSYFFKKQINLGELFLAEALATALIVVYIVFKGVFHTRSDMQLGMVLICISLVILFFPFSRNFFYIYTAFRAIGHIIFYIPYNIIYFNNTKQDKKLQGMAWYFAVGIISGIVGPVVGGYLLELNFALFTVVALIVMGAAGILTFHVPQESFTYSVKGVFGKIKNLRTINIMDGMLQKTMVITTTFALLYISSAFEYGLFLSFTAIVAMIGSLYLAKVSDLTKRRMIFMIPLCLACGGVILLFPFAKTFLPFVILIIILKLFLVLADPVRANVIQDSMPHEPVNWISREMFINLGRSILFLIAYLCMRFNWSAGIFLFMALLHFIYPFLIRHKKIY